MREKVISLAKGNFIYETPKLLLPKEPLVFSVTAGERKIHTFSLANERGSKLKGFGTVEDVHIDFLPFFDGENNELTMEVDARELMPGEHLKGDIWFITDCGESRLAYDISVVALKWEDKKGEITDYGVLQERIENNPEYGVDLFLSPMFEQTFLFRDEKGKLLYDYLTRKNTKLQGMEEFLVAMGKKEAIRFEVEHTSGSEIFYEIDGNVDIQDSLLVRVNTWGHTGIKVRTTADFIETQTPVLWTDEFQRRKEVLEFTILAERIPCGKRQGELILQSPYEKKIVKIVVHNRKGEQDRKVKRAKKAVLAQFIRRYLAYKEKRLTTHNYQAFLLKHREVLEKVSGTYERVLHGYIAVVLQEEEEILNFFRETESMKMPPIGATMQEVESYILIEFIKVLYTQREEDRERIVRLLDVYAESGYQNDLLLYIRTQVDTRYRLLRILEREVRAQLEAGSNSPLLYSVMMLAYREDATLIATLDEVTLNTINYGLKRDLTTKEISMAVSFLAERLPRFCSKVFFMLQRLYDFFVMADTLHAICGMLIRNEIRNRQYFPWFEKGVSRHLRLTDLFEYYMYTLDYREDTVLPDAILSYFQYENHLNDSCKANLFSYIVVHRDEQPEVYCLYEKQIEEFVRRQLQHRRISKTLALLYENCLAKETMTEEEGQFLAGILFMHEVNCECDTMDGVVVVHRECQGEKYYPLENGCALVQIYTPNFQLYFVDERGRYYAETVAYSITPLLHISDLALSCYERGGESEELLIYLAVLAERAPRMQQMQAEVLHRVVVKGVLRPYWQDKALRCLYDYYKTHDDTTSLLQILDLIEPYAWKKERLSEVAATCIYQGMYEKATQMLCRSGVKQCDTKALSMLLQQRIQEQGKEFEPLLVKWGLQLYYQGVYEKSIMEYLLLYYMGNMQTLTDIYRKGCQIPEVTISESVNERLLAQALFVGADLMAYEDIFLRYFEQGENRMLVKAFLSQLAYEYIVEQTVLSESLIVKIEKEAMYAKEDVMILATLRYYSKEKKFADKQREFVEMNLEKFAGEGLILAFMKDYIGKVHVPYEVSNTVLVQYYSGTESAVFLIERSDEKKEKPMPMRQVFPGVFIREVLLFEDEEKECYIYEEESGEKTDVLTVKRKSEQPQTNGFFTMINAMIKEQKNGDTVSYENMRRVYERAHKVAENLFTIH